MGAAGRCDDCVAARGHRLGIHAARGAPLLHGPGARHSLAGAVNRNRPRARQRTRSAGRHRHGARALRARRDQRHMDARLWRDNNHWRRRCSRAARFLLQRLGTQVCRLPRQYGHARARARRHTARMLRQPPRLRARRRQHRQRRPWNAAYDVGLPHVAQPQRRPLPRGDRRRTAPDARRRTRAVAMWTPLYALHRTTL